MVANNNIFLFIHIIIFMQITIMHYFANHALALFVILCSDVARTVNFRYPILFYCGIKYHYMHVFSSRQYICLLDLILTSLDMLFSLSVFHVAVLYIIIK